MHSAIGKKKLALAWLTRAAEANHHQAAATLGKMYASGLGVELNPEQAAGWFQKAGETADAQDIEENECD